MTYFSKTQANDWSPIVPSIILPLVYKDLIGSNVDQNRNKFWTDNEGNFIIDEAPFTLHVGCWQLSNLLIADLIDDKLGYERNELKLTDKLSSSLGTDSLDLIEIALFLEKTAGIPIYEELRFDRVSDLIDYVFSIMIYRIHKSRLGWPKATTELVLD